MLSCRLKLHLARFSYALRGIEDFQGNQIAGFIIIEDHAGLIFITLSYLRVVLEDDAEGIGLLVVGNLHRLLPPVFGDLASTIRRYDFSGCPINVHEYANQIDLDEPPTVAPVGPVSHEWCSRSSLFLKTQTAHR